MTGGRCLRRRKVVHVGGIEIPRVPTEENIEIEQVDDKVVESLDSFTQARKALSDRSPFDFEDGQNVCSGNLPRELASLLIKRTDGRKRHRKSHSAGESKSQRLEKSRGVAFWAGKEVYFRGLSVGDIDKLCELSSFEFTETSECLSIPFVRNEKTGMCSGGGNGNVSGGDEVVVANVAQVKDKCDEEFMEVDSAGVVLNVQDKYSGLKQQVSGLEWLLGSRSKIYLTSERPSKKRKLLGADAGLEKLYVSSAVEGSSSLCHYCGLGDTGDHLNRLIVCSMCNMVVHKRCYGVQEDVAESWLCSWCMNRNQEENSERPCLLCPKQGGALKPVQRRGCGSDNGGSMEFVHLFCCQWMPELHVEDTRRMEPIMNFEGIKETRHKLICRLCRIRCGACVRCSNGTCRASFHPICAREARQRMEIWGKYGSDDVELRAFCSKHSEGQNNASVVQVDQSLLPSSDLAITNHQPVSSTMTKPHKIKISRRNGDVEGHLETSELDLDRVDCSASRAGVLPDATSNPTNQLGCDGTQQPNSALILDKRSSEDVDTTESSNFQIILKKLMDQGKVNVNNVASEIGVSSEFLASNLIGDNMVPGLQSKIVEWMKNHAYIGPLQRNLKVRFKNLTIVEAVANDETDGIVSESCIPDVSVTSIPPRRRTKSDIRILKDGKALCLTRADSRTNNGAQHLIRDEPASQSEESVPDTFQKILLEPAGSQDTLPSNSSKIEGEGSKLSYGAAFGSFRAEEGAVPEKSVALDSIVCDTGVTCVPDLINVQSISSSYMHPTIRKTLSEMPNSDVTGLVIDENDGLRDRELSALEASFSSRSCCNNQSDELASPGPAYNFGPGLEQLAKARKMGILEQSPADEVEGELIFFQQQLLHNALARKRFSDDLMSKILRNLPEEIDALGKQKWDAVAANKFLSELREVKKQGRKERRHKEAQAVLAAATAAAAASSRISSFRKDSQEESVHQDINPSKANFSSGRAGLYSQQMPRAKETLSRLGTTRVSSEKNYDAVYSTSDFSKDHPRTCEICRRSETILNPILICTSCKIAVHLDCYRSVKDSGGPWYCELCEDLASWRSFGALAVNSWEKPYFLAECGLCGGTGGAFRKTIDGQWIHAFCAEWVLESTFKRGQANPVKGMETVSKGSEMCHICRRKQGVCIKCNYGHCQSSFHPSCASSAGFQMNLKTSGGKLQHKAYCEKHSLVERAKAETPKHGMEELKSFKPVRVELEKLRLLCERIIRREKLKRELVLCSHEILASNREAASLSALACSSFCQTDVSSESATTLLKSCTDGYKSGNEAIQRSDDITVDSTVAGKSRMKFPVPVDNDQKTDDSSTSQQLCPSKPSDGASFSGKQILSRPSSVASWSLPSEAENSAKYIKHTETFEKELVMTSDQASMKNQRLPKGLVYVPIHCLSSEKEAVPDACSTQELKSDD